MTAPTLPPPAAPTRRTPAEEAARMAELAAAHHAVCPVCNPTLTPKAELAAILIGAV
jgi:hypothetical protein